MLNTGPHSCIWGGAALSACDVCGVMRYQRSVSSDNKLHNVAADCVCSAFNLLDVRASRSRILSILRKSFVAYIFCSAEIKRSSAYEYFKLFVCVCICMM